MFTIHFVFCNVSNLMTMLCHHVKLATKVKIVIKIINKSLKSFVVNIVALVNFTKCRLRSVLSKSGLNAS